MKIGILTSTRADFGIYTPLIQKLFADSFFDPELIVFGTHLSEKHGYTISEIEQNGFPIKHKIETVPNSDTPFDISEAIGKTIVKFSKFWQENKFDLVFALGDRYEMFAAVTAGLPFNVTFGHIHAGETTLGAIDNALRHSISLMSKYLFVSTDEYKKRAVEITQKPDNIFVTGALSIDNLVNTKLYTVEEFKEIYNIDLNKPTILSTFHPETVNYEKNKNYIDELIKAFDKLRNKYQIIITMPNADTMGLFIRNKINSFAKDKENVITVENFGMRGYLSCMKHSSFLLGNTSSGFVEAAFFPKWVINLGHRQDGRIITPNIYSIPIEEDIILGTVNKIEKAGNPPFSNIYGDGNASGKIVEILKKIYNGN